MKKAGKKPKRKEIQRNQDVMAKIIELVDGMQHRLIAIENKLNDKEIVSHEELKQEIFDVMSTRYKFSSIQWTNPNELAAEEIQLVKGQVQHVFTSKTVPIQEFEILNYEYKEEEILASGKVLFYTKEDKLDWILKSTSEKVEILVTKEDDTIVDLNDYRLPPAPEKEDGNPTEDVVAVDDENIEAAEHLAGSQVGVEETKEEPKDETEK